MLHLHVTQIVVVVGEGGLALGAGPLRRGGGLSAARPRRLVIPGSLVVLVCVIVLVVVFLVVLLVLLLPAPVLPVRVLRLPRRLGFGARGAGRVGRGRGRGGGGSVGLRLGLFG